MSGPVTISNVAARLFVVPLDEVLVDAKHGAHSHFHLITATVTLSDGRQGTGYTYTGGRGGHAIAAMIRHDLAPFLTGREAADTAALNEAMDWHLHYVGRGGVLSFAISAVDIALWDLDLKARGLSLVRAAGGASDRCRAYGGGIDLGFDLPKLLAQTQGYLDAGLDAIKIKVGQPEPAQDIARIAAVRAAGRGATQRRLAGGSQLSDRPLHDQAAGGARPHGDCPGRARHRGAIRPGCACPVRGVTPGAMESREQAGRKQLARRQRVENL